MSSVLNLLKSAFRFTDKTLPHLFCFLAWSTIVAMITTSVTAPMIVPAMIPGSLPGEWQRYMYMFYPKALH